MKFYEATNLCRAAHRMTGNENFNELIVLLDQCLKLYELGREVTAGFPSDGPHNGYYNLPQLPKQISERIKHTSDFIRLLNDFNKKSVGAKP